MYTEYAKNRLLQACVLAPIIIIIFIGIAVTKLCSSDNIDNTSIVIIYLDVYKECVLIKNTSAKDINLSRWTLKDDNEHSYTFSYYTLKAGQTLQMQSGTRNSRIKKLRNTHDYVIWTNKNVWNNEGDTAYLYDAGNNLVQKREYK